MIDHKNTLRRTFEHCPLYERCLVVLVKTDIVNDRWRRHEQDVSTQCFQSIKSQIAHECVTPLVILAAEGDQGHTRVSHYLSQHAIKVRDDRQRLTLWE